VGGGRDEGNREYSPKRYKLKRRKIGLGAKVIDKSRRLKKASGGGMGLLELWKNHEQ